MSLEAWGTPPDLEPDQREPWLTVPQLGPRQQWTCANGCGVCTVKTIAHVRVETTNIRTGEVVTREYEPVDVSSCCGADLGLWDDDLDAFVTWEPVQRPEIDDATLLPFGYVPGNYSNKRLLCLQVRHGVDKRSYICRECAEVLYLSRTEG